MKRNTLSASRAAELLQSQPGVREARVNVRTGSLLMTYDAQRVHPEELLAVLKANGLCRIDVVLPSKPVAMTNALPKSIVGAGSKMGRAAVGVLVEKAVERSAVALIGAIL